MKINSTLNGGVRNYVSILPALFPAIVFLMIGMNVRSSAVPPVMKVNPLVERVRQIYTSQIGIREKPVNSGPQVEKYLKYVGLGKGNPWCAAFVCWVLGEVGIVNPKTGWSPSLFPANRLIWTSIASPVSRSKYQESRFVGGKVIGYRPLQTSDFRLPTSDNPRCAYPPRPITCLPDRQADYRLPITHSSPTTGDVFGLFFPEKGRIAHTGFVDQWNGTWMISVEGNTNIAGSREGDGVYRKRRLVKSVYQVARYIND